MFNNKIDEAGKVKTDYPTNEKDYIHIINICRTFIQTKNNAAIYKVREGYGPESSVIDSSDKGILIYFKTPVSFSVDSYVDNEGNLNTTQVTVPAGLYIVLAAYMDHIDGMDYKANYYDYETFMCDLLKVRNL